jgi:hypothetical protein
MKERFIGIRLFGRPGTRVTVREKAGTIGCLDDEEKTGEWGEPPRLWTFFDEE